MTNQPDSALITAACHALQDYLQIQDKEKALLVFDETTVSIADAFIAAAADLSISLQARQITPPGGHGREPDAETSDLMKNFAVVICPTLYSLTHTAATREAAGAGARVATMPGINVDLFLKGLKTDPKMLHDDGEKWIAKLSGKHQVRVTTDLGTDVAFQIGQYPLINDDGCLTKGGIYGNLPAGEAFVAPDIGTAHGTIISDGTIGGLAWHEGDGSAILTLANGVITDFAGERGQGLEEILRPHGEKAFVLAEFGIGTNPDLQMSGSLLGDEKLKGTIHLAFGNNCSMGGDNDVPVHIDCLVTAPTVQIENQTLMQAGQWRLAD